MAPCNYFYGVNFVPNPNPNPTRNRFFDYDYDYEHDYDGSLYPALLIAPIGQGEALILKTVVSLRPVGLLSSAYQVRYEYWIKPIGVLSLQYFRVMWE